MQEFGKFEMKNDAGLQIGPAEKEEGGMFRVSNVGT